MHVPFLYTLSIILLTYGLKKTGIFHADDSKILTKIVMNLTIPALILLKIPLVPLTADLFFLPFIAILLGLVSLGFGIFFFRTSPSHLKGLMLMGTMGLNLGLFAFPILEALFGSEGIKIAAIMDMGNSVLVLGVSYLTGAHYSPLFNNSRRGFKQTLLAFLKTVPISAYIIAVFMNLHGLRLPVIIADWGEILSRANQFLVLMILGLILSFNWRHHIKSGVIRLIFLRLITSTLFSFLVWYVIPVDLLIKKIILLCLFLPGSFTVVPFSMEFGYDRDTAGAIVNITLIVGFFIMWGLMIIL